MMPPFRGPPRRRPVDDRGAAGPTRANVPGGPRDGPLARAVTAPRFSTPVPCRGLHRRRRDAALAGIAGLALAGVAATALPDGIDDRSDHLLAPARQRVGMLLLQEPDQRLAHRAA